MKEGTSAQLSGRGELHGGARVTTLVTLRKCTLGNKREMKTLKFVSASTKGFNGGSAWIKPSKKDMAVTFSYSYSTTTSPCHHTHQRRGTTHNRHTLHTTTTRSSTTRRPRYTGPRHTSHGTPPWTREELRTHTSNTRA